ncbi:MAG: hypothetical protein ACI4TI_04175, partial [Christensenellales bacterium]
FLCDKLNSKTAKYLIDFRANADYFKTKIVDIKYADALAGFDNILCFESNLNSKNVFNINKLCDKIVMGENLIYAF